MTDNYNEPPMRILCIADIHAHFADFDPAAMPHVDLCAIAGDITEHGRSLRRRHDRELGEAREWLGALGARYPTFVIPGNHDTRITNDDFEGIPGVTPIMARRSECGGLTLYGVNLSPCYGIPRWARLYDYMTIDYAEEDAAYDFEFVDIVVSHCPPYGVLDCMRDNKNVHIGSEALLRYINRNHPALVVCGHVHFDTGDAMVGSTHVINVSKRWDVVEIAK
jgi:Icc-related predicted phosphoesterase